MNEAQVKKRLRSLDIFRGISIVMMIFVWYGGGYYWWMQHAVWNGFLVSDIVFPWFLFIMGVCIPISIKSQLSKNMAKIKIVQKIITVGVCEIVK
jgi:heparan-alpha-glucosaminide N-acetyltransferase